MLAVDQYILKADTESSLQFSNMNIASPCPARPAQPAYTLCWSVDTHAHMVLTLMMSSTLISSDDGLSPAR